MNIVGANIISSSGFTVSENYENVKRGISSVKRCGGGMFSLPDAFAASLIDRMQMSELFCYRCDPSLFADYSFLEKAAILSVLDANDQANIDLSSEKTIFILSTTKGDIAELNSYAEHPAPRAYLWRTAQIVAGCFKNPNTPIVVSNACVSGAAAQIAAMRELENGNFDYAVVTGVDFMSKFIISGFQSFKALSPDICRPFDKERCGLNLGEAAATIIYSRRTSPASSAQHTFSLINGAIRNDANHISGPSRTGEGLFRALNYVLKDIDKEEIAFINAHGTATPYNDDMEATAIERAGLQTVPVNSLKACFGHTLGAAGVLEAIISMEALKEGLVLKSFNYCEQNFEHKINVAQENQPTGKRYFVKMLSGFGGVNAVLLFEKIK